MRCATGLGVAFVFLFAMLSLSARSQQLPSGYGEQPKLPARRRGGFGFASAIAGRLQLAGFDDHRGQSRSCAR